MKHYDSAGVWERVQSAPSGDPQSLKHLMDTLWLDARIFQHLTRKLPPQQVNIARELSRRVQQQLACLKGMHILISGAVPDIPSLPVPGDPPDLLLRQCYAQTLRLRSEYDARRSDPAYGHIFRALANDLPEQSRKILELLGTLTK